MTDKICVEIKSREDEKKWKEFLSYYFPNHYASSLLEEDLVIDIEARNANKGYLSKRIAVSVDGYGRTSMRLAHYGHYVEVEDFEEFKTTVCYQLILVKGVDTSYGEVEVIKIGK